MKPFVSSIAFKCRLGGFRVTYCDAERNPVVSLWGEDQRNVRIESRRLLEATPEPIDAILQAIAWHGKAAQA